MDHFSLSIKKKQQTFIRSNTTRTREKRGKRNNKHIVNNKC